MASEIGRPEDHVGLVWMHAIAAAKRYGRSSDELVSHGALGLANAFRTFDPTRGVKMSTWVSANVWQKLRKHVEADAQPMFGPCRAVRWKGNRHLPEREGFTDHRTPRVGSAEDAVDDRDERQHVRRVMRRLPRCWQALVLLLHCRRWSFMAIAAKAGTSHTTVRRIYRKAMAQLRRLLKAEVGNE